MSVRCDNCGLVVDDATVPLSWVSSVEDGESKQYCDRCARDNVRAIEARLDPAWW